MFAATVLPLVFLAGQPSAVTPELVAEKLKVLAESKSVEERFAAGNWFYKHAAEPSVLKVLKAIEDVATSDDVPDVRGLAVAVVGRVAVKNTLPCPQVVLDALFDREPDPDLPGSAPVASFALNALHEFRPPPPALLPAILHLLRSPEPLCRVDGLVLVNSFTGGNAGLRKLLDRQPAVARLVRKATTDPELEVRRVALYSQLKLTGDVAEFLGNALRHQDDAANLPDLPKDATEAEKRKRAGYNLGQLGVANMLHTEFHDHRDRERDAFVKVLKESDTRTRRLAAESLWRKAAFAESKPTADEIAGEDAAKKSRADARRLVTDPGVRDQLKLLAVKGGDAAARFAAAMILLRIETMTAK
jgi:hypothetical protein